MSSYLSTGSVMSAFAGSLFAAIIVVYSEFKIRRASKRGALSTEVENRLWWLRPFSIAFLAIALIFCFLSIVIPLSRGTFFARLYFPGLFLGATTVLGLRAISTEREIDELKRRGLGRELRNKQAMGTEIERLCFWQGVGLGLLGSIPVAGLLLWLMMRFTRTVVR